MKRRVILSTILTEAIQVKQLPDLPPEVNLIEVRADLFDVDLPAIRNACNAPLLFTLKSKLEGGSFTGYTEQRIQKIIDASAHYDFIELEGERDLIPKILEVVPVEKRIIAWQGQPENYEALQERFYNYLETPAKYYRFVIQAKKSGDELPVLRLLKTFNRNDLVAYATGTIGMWTQPLSVFLGSPLVPSLLNDDNSNTHFSPKQLVEDYNLPHTYRVEKIVGIVGNPVFGSISPKLHNEAYRTLSLPYIYLPFHANTLREFFDGVVNNTSSQINFSGFTVVSPFKEAGLKISGTSRDPDVFVSKASNILVNQNRTGWDALSTDALGVVDALNKVALNWRKKNIVIVGCGGTGRTIAAALKRMNVKLTLVNRTYNKGKEIANTMGLPFFGLDRFNPASFDILIHATPLGKNKGELPFDISKLQRNCVVIDHVYSLLEETVLVKYCRLCDITVIDGVEMAMLQIKHQFKFITGMEMPVMQIQEQIIKLK